MNLLLFAEDEDEYIFQLKLKKVKPIEVFST